MEINTNTLQQRRAAANAADVERNRARAAGEVRPIESNLGFALEGGEVARLTHDLGLSNQPESYAFIRRVLKMEQDLEVQGLVIIQLQEEVSALKRKGGYRPPKTETR